MKYAEPVSFYDGYNAIDSLDTVAVSSFGFSVDQITGEPKQMILSVCINRYRANCESPEFPVYIDADKIYHQPAHYMLLEKFESGDPFTYIQPKELVVYHHLIGEYYRYFGFCDGFVVPEYYMLGRNKR